MVKTLLKGRRITDLSVEAEIVELAPKAGWKQHAFTGKMFISLVVAP